MKLDFEAIKRIPIIEVAARYGVQLRYRGDWANAPCPLPTHKKGDKDRNFTVNVRENYWRCFSESCNQKNSGRKGGDVINFVALMENCSEFQAAQKLAGKLKTGPHIADRRSVRSETEHHKDSPDGSKSAVAGKGYIHEVGVWFDELIVQAEHEDDSVFWSRVKKGVVAKVLESFRNGKRAGSGLLIEPLSGADRVSS